MLVPFAEEEWRLVGLLPQFGSGQLEAVVDLAKLEQVHYPVIPIHLFLFVEEVLALHLLLCQPSEENFSFFSPFLSSLEGDSIQPGSQVGILFLA